MLCIVKRFGGVTALSGVDVNYDAFGASLADEMAKHVDRRATVAVLWNPADHGYLTVYAARQLATAGLQVGKEFNAGHIGARKSFADKVSMQILLGPPLVSWGLRAGDVRAARGLGFRRTFESRR